MQKKFFILFIAIISCFSMAACSSDVAVSLEDSIFLSDAINEDDFSNVSFDFTEDIASAFIYDSNADINESEISGDLENNDFKELKNILSSSSLSEEDYEKFFKDFNKKGNFKIFCCDSGGTSICIIYVFKDGSIYLSFASEDYVPENVVDKIFLINNENISEFCSELIK